MKTVAVVCAVLLLGGCSQTPSKATDAERSGAEPGHVTGTVLSATQRVLSRDELSGLCPQSSCGAPVWRIWPLHVCLSW